jgi:ATP-dependent DNA helicase RecQ
MIDSPIQVHGGQEIASKAQFKRALSQLPWAMEYALIQNLYETRKEWFAQNKAPDNPQVTCANANFSPDSATDYTNVEPYYIGPSYILEYAFSGAFYKEFSIFETTGGQDGVPPSVEDWMNNYGLYETSDDNADPHFAERAFIVNVLVPAYGKDVLSSIRPQKLFEEYSYQVDFFVDTPRGEVVVEVDGREYHDPVKIGSDRFEYELKRQNYIQSLGHMVFRYPARRILQEPDSVITEIRENIPIIGSGQQTLFESSEAPKDENEEVSGESKELNLVLEYCKWFRPMQLGLLLALVKFGSTDRFRIVERNSPPGLLYLCLIDLGLLINQACRLYDIDIALPQLVEIVVQDGEHDSEVPNAILENFFEAVLKGPDGFHPIEKFLPFAINQKTDEGESTDRTELIVDLKREGRIPLLPEGPAYPDVLGCESANIPTLRARLNAMSLARPGPRNSLRPKNLEKKLLDYFARRFLKIPFLYHHHDAERLKTEQRQYELVRRVLQGESVLGIMPTGRGKSVAFQLPAMLLPGGALIISPLRALMRDQLEDLRCRRGFNSVESIRYDMRGDEKDRALDDFIKGYTNLLYVSPERLQEIKFSETLAKAASTVHISFLAIDEAHCVSEWGHDFRLSYLHIPIFLEKLEAMQDGILCPILGLTATASPPVRRDVCAILRFSANDARYGGNLVAEANIDRTELSLSVHYIEGESYPEDRQMVLSDVLTRVLPTALSYNHRFSWEEFSNGETESTGAVFCIYAKPQGQTSWQDGVGAVRDSIISQQIIDDEHLRIFAASSPGFCPVCFDEDVLTYAIRNVPKKEREDDNDPDSGAYVCSIGHYFAKPHFHEGWNEYVSKTQFDFKDKQFPLLVSTKAFGMGVDHRWLRFIIHYGFSSSIEAYYQEVGRAGRDKNHAHCALLVRIPHEQCLQLVIEGEDSSEGAAEDVALPGCMKSTYFNNRQCPPEIGLPEPCDFSRQLRMILNYYVKPEGLPPCVDDVSKITLKIVWVWSILYQAFSDETSCYGSEKLSQKNILKSFIKTQSF